MRAIQLEFRISVMVKFQLSPAFGIVAGRAFAFFHLPPRYLDHLRELPSMNILVAILAFQGKTCELQFGLVRQVGFSTRGGRTTSLMAFAATYALVLSLQRQSCPVMIERGLPPAFDHVTIFASIVRCILCDLPGVGVLVA
jgi:hypothetical protein